MSNRLEDLVGLKDMPCLITLNLERNKLTSLKGLANLPALKTLLLKGNQISSFGAVEDMPALPALTYLNLEENKIDKDGPEIDKCSELPKLAGFTALTKISMQGNPYADSNEEGFKREVLIALDMLKWESVNDDEVIEEDRADAKEEKINRQKAEEEARQAQEEEAARLAAEKADVDE